MGNGDSKSQPKGSDFSRNLPNTINRPSYPAASTRGVEGLTQNYSVLSNNENGGRTGDSNLKGSASFSKDSPSTINHPSYPVTSTLSTRSHVQSTDTPGQNYSQRSNSGTPNVHVGIPPDAFRAVDTGNNPLNHNPQVINQSLSQVNNPLNKSSLTDENYSDRDPMKGENLEKMDQKRDFSFGRGNRRGNNGNFGCSFPRDSTITGSPLTINNNRGRRAGKGGRGNAHRNRSGGHENSFERSNVLVENTPQQDFIFKRGNQRGYNDNFIYRFPRDSNIIDSPLTINNDRGRGAARGGRSRGHESSVERSNVEDILQQDFSFRRGNQRGNNSNFINSVPRYSNITNSPLTLNNNRGRRAARGGRGNVHTDTSRGQESSSFERLNVSLDDTEEYKSSYKHNYSTDSDAESQLLVDNIRGRGGRWRGNRGIRGHDKANRGRGNRATGQRQYSNIKGYGNPNFQHQQPLSDLNVDSSEDQFNATYTNPGGDEQNWEHCLLQSDYGSHSQSSLSLNIANTKYEKRKRNNNKKNNKPLNDGQIQNEKQVDRNASEQDISLSIEQLEIIITLDPKEIVQILSEDKNDYSVMFKEDLDQKMFILVLEVLKKVCDAEPSRDRAELMRQISLPVFMDHMFNFISDFPYIEDKDLLHCAESVYANVLTLYDTLSSFMPSAGGIWKNHLVEVEKSMKAVVTNWNIQLDPNLFVILKSLLCDVLNSTTAKSIEPVNEPAKKKEVFFPDPVGDFRTVPLYPRPEDVFAEQPFLYPNLIHGPYSNVDHYLDTHFKLLREDFMSPIRKAIKDYKKQQQNSKDKFKRIDNVRIYRKVKFLTPQTITDKVGYEVCFDVDNKIKKVNWEFSNRFMFGSLLLLTNDHFDTFFLATVANRNVKQLEKKLVIVEVIGPSQNAKSILGKEFVMAESEAYFEPYFHVLKALQMFTHTNFPFAKYLVGVSTRTEPPKYLGPADVYHITTENNQYTFRALSDIEWPTNIDLGLDPSQYEAYKAALTNDLVVIQGPPGTGKTFLGLKIARSLLNNAHLWNKNSSPILVVCFTNHALDQFLEGLLPVTSKLVRIGGKSKGSELDKFNIRERRREYSYYKKTQTKELRNLHVSMSRAFAELNIFQTNVQKLDNVDGVLSLQTLEFVMPDNQRDYFASEDHLMDWLLAGVGSSKVDKKVKIIITADRGVVKETPKVDPMVADEEDQRVKQAFFDAIDIDTAASPSEDTVQVHFACHLDGICKKQEEILQQLNSYKIRNKYNQRVNLQASFDNLDLILQHLRKELLEFKQFPRSEHERKELLRQPFLDDLQPTDRWKLYHTWVDILRNGLIIELEKKETEFRDYAFRYEQLRQADDIQILKTSHVVGTTTTIAARLQPMFTALAPKIVIVEEAAEVLEAHIVASMTKDCEHLILIGDHKQLRPNVAEVRLARQFQLDVSLFERMVINGMACHTLTLQHRMRPEISKQLVPVIYPTLQDHVSVTNRESIRGMDKNVFFMTHRHFEDNVEEVTSKKNAFEAEIMLKLAKYLVQQGYKPEEITILATYKGQMFHMKNVLRNINDFPKGIQITVVDNFQGEENKIILLSLVRSNPINKIGFLEIENRVCVALSRARDGLYIVGNMDNLTTSSKIWPYIKSSLTQQQAIGSSLNLRCQIHKDQVTQISCGKDFSKVSEGGCSLLCGQTLRCGHACKSMCHVSLDYHDYYKCREPCPRILCQDGHQCPKKCHMKCEVCMVPVRRQLTCNHFADVPCHVDIRNYMCEERVTVLVRLCGHSAIVPCHSKSNPQCNIQCEIRLECGHSCDRVCHVDDDPDHLDFACLKRCPRLKKHCSEDHKCQLACFEECQPCMEKVQKELPCGHSAKMVCSADLSSVQCKKKCTRTLHCGHQCNKKCWEPCQPCPVIVEKTVPQCGHVVSVACSQQPTKQLCDGACSEKLSCGHSCAQRCRDPCSAQKCQHPKRFKITTLLCGHIYASIPCNKASTVNTMSEEDLMQFCEEPCRHLLTCQHPCSGSCSDCMQGRIHKVCDHPCGNVLICGHSCPVPCRDVCPPCNQPCTHRCKHTRCPKRCGEVCVSCTEPCDYACPHLQCGKMCGELCDRRPCYEACPQQLPCNHPCVGFCGEPCPPCRQCEPTHFEEFFYTGEETEDDAKWVYLEDCKHTFESSGLEYWLNMKQEGSEIVSKVCPRCKSPIIKVQRFMNLIKQTYQDIQQVKAQMYGKIEDIKRQRAQALKKLQEVEFVVMASPDHEPDELQLLYEKLKNDLPEVKMKKRNAVDAQKIRLLCFLTEFFISLYEAKVGAWERLDEGAKAIVSKKINFLTQLLKKRELKISEQEMKSFELELKRVHRFCDLLSYTSSLEYRTSLSYSGANITKKQAEDILCSVAVYNDSCDEKIKDLLKKLKDQIKSSMEITDAERAMINKAMASNFHSGQKTGHWFKCKNGHVYCITECGGAMEEAMCPVRGCGETIGGRNHALRSDQALASEMDGARHAAWSDQNNMENFGFRF